MTRRTPTRNINNSTTGIEANIIKEVDVDSFEVGVVSDEVGVVSGEVPELVVDTIHAHSSELHVKEECQYYCNR